MMILFTRKRQIFQVSVKSLPFSWKFQIYFLNLQPRVKMIYLKYN